jgi:hypothetical protein
MRLPHVLWIARALQALTEEAVQRPELTSHRGERMVGWVDWDVLRRREITSSGSKHILSLHLLDECLIG